MPNNKKIFLVVDSNSLFHRAYHALPRLMTQKGELVNAVYGFSTILIKALKDFKPDYLAAAFDVSGPTFRDNEFDAYKATRDKAPDELYAQIPRIKEMLEAFNVPVYEKEGFEADDVIGTIAAKLEKEHSDIHTIIVSGDLDTLQLVSKSTSVYTMKKSVTETVVYNVRAVKERFGLDPKQLADYKGLRGDTSDNIPGVPGIGEKTASILLQKHENLEKLYDAVEKNKEIGVSDRIKKLLVEHKEQAFFSRMLAQIRLDVPINLSVEHAKWGGFNPVKVEELLKELGFNRLISRLGELEGFEAKDADSGDKKEGGREAQLVREIEDANEAGLLSDYLYKIEKELVSVILKMEENGIKIDKKSLNKLRVELENQLGALEKKIYREAGQEFNINSPQQLSDILFEKLEISTKGIKKTPGKKISTAASELEKIKNTHPVVDMVLEQRELQKMLSTYIHPLPELADENSRIHTTFQPMGTTTGRLSSKNPNMQNIPIRGEFAKKIRNTFVADKGNLLLACDYSQMELRVAAHLAKDKNMINVFKNDEDIHINTAALVFGVPKKEVTKKMRYDAKALNFGIIYGIGPRAFAQSAGITFDEAQEFIDKYLKVFDGVAAYMEETKEKAYKLGYVETMFGRKRFLPDLKSPNPMHRSMAERAAINMPVQGTAADIVKIAMIKAYKDLKNIDILLQIHDELLWEGDSDTIKKTAEHAKDILENAVELSVPLKVEYKIGESWGEMK
ncbi:MAG: DNA polymerase [Candidatus Spechtbacterales bacterium]